MNEDKIIMEIVELKTDVTEIKEAMKTTLVTKADLEPIVRTQDEILVILKRLDNERLVNNHRITNLEDRDEKHNKDITQIKVNLKMA